jgi:hypothetical protein
MKLSVGRDGMVARMEIADARMIAYACRVLSRFAIEEARLGSSESAIVAGELERIGGAFGSCLAIMGEGVYLTPTEHAVERRLSASLAQGVGAR